jgi:hypothetical protein
MKLVYVNSGQLRVKLEAKNPIEAITCAFERFGDGKQLDPNFIYIDERGYRTRNARYKVPVEQALAEAGYTLGPDGPQAAED